MTVEGELNDVSWQLKEDGTREVVARWTSDGGRIERREYTLDGEGTLDALPEEVARVLADDERDFGVWTRD